MVTSHSTLLCVHDRIGVMPVDQEGCLHLFSSVLHKPISRRPHGLQYVDKIECKDCPEYVLLRTFDDPRDDNSRFLPPDGPATRKDTA